MICKGNKRECTNGVREAAARAYDATEFGFDYFHRVESDHVVRSPDAWAPRPSSGKLDVNWLV